MTFTDHWVDGPLNPWASDPGDDDGLTDEDHRAIREDHICAMHDDYLTWQLYA